MTSSLRRFRTLFLIGIASITIAGCAKRLYVEPLGTEYGFRDYRALNAEVTEIEDHFLDANRFELRRESQFDVADWNRLFSFVHVSDVQIRDAGIKYLGIQRSLWIDKVISSTERVELLDRNDEVPFVALVGAVSEAADEIRFLLHTGDAIDAGTVGELVAFQAIANQLKIPWFGAVGNHDVLLFGNFSQRGGEIAAPIGWGNLMMDTREKFLALHGENSLVPWPQIQQHAATEEAVGGLSSFRHGFDRRNRDSDPDDHPAQIPAAAYYSVLLTLQGEQPVRLLVLDTARPDSELLSIGDRDVPGIGACGEMLEDQFQWLRGEIDEARTADETVLVAGHHPISALGGCGALPTPDGPLLAYLRNQRHVVAYLGGHTHWAAIREHETATGPLWEIIAPSLHVFPQIALQIDVMDASDGRRALHVQPLKGEIVAGPLRERSSRACEGARAEAEREDAAECWQIDDQVNRILVLR